MNTFLAPPDAVRSKVLPSVAGCRQEAKWLAASSERSHLQLRLNVNMLPT